MSGFARCPRCKGQLQPSGIEPHRHVCEGCGQHFQAVLQFVPVEPVRRRPELLLEPGDDAG